MTYGGESWTFSGTAPGDNVAQTGVGKPGVDSVEYKGSESGSAVRNSERSGAGLEEWSYSLTADAEAAMVDTVHEMV